MRLGLIDRLRRLVRRREAVGRHRRDAGGDAQYRDAQYRDAQYRDGGRSALPAFQPPAQLPQRPVGPGQRAVRPRQVPVGPELARTDQPAPSWGSPAVAGPPAVPGLSAQGGGGIGRARIRELPADPQQAGAWQARAQYGEGVHAEALHAEAQFGAAPVEAPGRAVPRQPWYQVVTGLPATTRPGPGRIAPPGQALAAGQGQASPRAGALAGPVPAAALSPARARLPYVAGHPVGHPVTLDGRRNCGPLEPVLHRQWHEGATLPAAVITAIDRLAELPRHIQQRLADGLTGIFVGPGGVPELDEMGALRGVALPSGRATWDACAGAYGERKLVVGSRLSPTPDVMCHEVGHALDDLDSPAGKWQSDSPEFKAVYDHCKPHIVSDFHRQRGGLGRKEFFADAFAAIASGQRPALVDMLGGDTRSALWVMLYFNRRYGI